MTDKLGKRAMLPHPSWGSRNSSSEVAANTVPIQISHERWSHFVEPDVPGEVRKVTRLTLGDAFY